MENLPLKSKLWANWGAEGGGVSPFLAERVAQPAGSGVGSFQSWGADAKDAELTPLLLFGCAVAGCRWVSQVEPCPLGAACPLPGHHGSLSPCFGFWGAGGASSAVSQGSPTWQGRSQDAWAPFLALNTV